MNVFLLHQPWGCCWKSRTRNIQTQSHKAPSPIYSYKKLEHLWNMKINNFSRPKNKPRFLELESNFEFPRTWNMQVQPQSPVAESSTSTSHSDGGKLQMHAAFWMLRCVLHALQTLSSSILTVTLWNLKFVKALRTDVGWKPFVESWRETCPWFPFIFSFRLGLLEFFLACF